MKAFLSFYSLKKKKKKKIKFLGEATDTWGQQSFLAVGRVDGPKLISWIFFSLHFYLLFFAFYYT